MLLNFLIYLFFFLLLSHEIHFGHFGHSFRRDNDGVSPTHTFYSERKDIDSRTAGLYLIILQSDSLKD